MRTRSMIFVLAALVGLTLFGGAMHGRLSGRWGPPSQLRVAGGNAADLPPDFLGDRWECTLSSPFGKVEVDELQPTGHWSRRYVNRTTGEVVDLSLVVGPPGRIAVHTPEVCLGWRVARPRAPVVVPGSDGSENSFWGPIFESPGPGKTRLRVYYGWRVDGPWIASGQTRYVFAASPLLWKVQASCVLSPWADPNTPDAAQHLLRDFVARAEPYLDVSEHAPRIQVLLQRKTPDDSGERIDVIEVFDGSGQVDFGTTPVGTPVQRQFVVNNVGTLDLALDAASLEASLPDGFSVAARFDPVVPGGGSTAFAIQLDAARPGSCAGTLALANNDADENPYEFTIRGEAVAPAAGNEK